MPECLPLACAGALLAGDVQVLLPIIERGNRSRRGTACDRARAERIEQMRCKPLYEVMSESSDNAGFKRRYPFYNRPQTAIL
jgi:hypothetical protein